MPTSRFSESHQGHTPFLDRAEELRVISRHVELLKDDPGHLKVFEIIGLGGVGKTRLLSEIRDQIDSKDGRTSLIWVPLASEAAATAVGPLRLIRGQLRFDCLLFDAALLSYWIATGQPVQSPGNRQRGVSFALQSLESGGTLAGLPLPLTFAADVFEKASRSLTRRRRYDRAEFQAIDEYRQQPAELYARLPHYLALDMQRRATQTRHYVVFYDAYEKQGTDTVTAGAPWLREFIATLDSGVHVISTRDPLEWDAGEWAGVLQAVTLDALPDGDCRAMVRAELGAVPEAIEDLLVDASHRLPFFLEAAIDVYWSQLRDQEVVDAAALPTSPDAVVNHLISHLARNEYSLAVALATLKYFDESLYLALVRALNLPLGVVDFDEFTEWFFVTAGPHGLYETHDLLTDSVRGSARFRGVARRALQAATDHLALLAVPGAVDDVERDLQLFHAVLEGWQAIADIPVAALEGLIDVGYRFYDAGHWQGLSNLPAIGGADAPTVADLPSRFFTALVTRRIHSALRALELLEPLEALRNQLGRHGASFDLEVAYLSEIVGNYHRAREDFAALNDRNAPFDPTRRDHVRARLYHADMLIMDGAFTTASRLLLETSELIGADSPLDWAELVRHRGHAHRFSLVFGTAEHLYLEALHAADEAPGMRGKLYTNLVETRCWLLPELALSDSTVAIRLNSEIGNQLEIAKCEAAIAIALARTQDWDGARERCESAHDRSKDLHYPAGVAFALQARVVIEATAGRVAEAADAYDSLATVIGSLGTYGHLSVIPAWLLGDGQRLGPQVSGFEWLAGEALHDRLSELRVQLT